MTTTEQFQQQQQQMSRMLALETAINDTLHFQQRPGERVVGIYEWMKNGHAMYFITLRQPFRNPKDPGPHVARDVVRKLVRAIDYIDWRCSTLPGGIVVEGTVTR